jgi:hypothetical protein
LTKLSLIRLPHLYIDLGLVDCTLVD